MLRFQNLAPCALQVTRILLVCPKTDALHVFLADCASTMYTCVAAYQVLSTGTGGHGKVLQGMTRDGK